MHAGYVYLHRRAIDSRVFSDAELWRLFTWCLMRANWKDGYFQGDLIKRGSFAVSRSTAAEQLGVSPSKFRRGVEKLKEYGVIAVESTSRYTLIRVENYEEYQNPAANAGQQPTNDRPTTDQQVNRQPTTIEEGKKREEEKEFGGRCARTLRIPPSLDSEEFRTAWEAWCNWCEAETGRPLNPFKAQQQLEDLARGPEKAADDIRVTIAKATHTGRIWDSSREKSKSNGKPRLDVDGILGESN